MSTKNKFSKGKMIASIFGLTLLVAGVGAGTILVQQQQTAESLAYEALMPDLPPSDKIGDKCTLVGSNPTRYIYNTVGGCNCRQTVKCVKTTGTKGIITASTTCFTYFGTTKGCLADCGIKNSSGKYYALQINPNKCDGYPGIK